MNADLPWLVRMIFKNDPAKFDLEKDMPYHVDIERLRKGKVGGFFWCVIDRECNVRDTVELARSSSIGPSTRPAPTPKRRALTM